MRGFAYLKEAGARFTVQLIPMAANWHEWDGMRKLARSISPESRIGAPWLFLSADRSPAKNARIEGQRLPPRVAVELDHCPRPMDPPDGGSAARKASGSAEAAPDDRIYAHCIASRREFHVDPYGKMSWCCFVKDPGPPRRPEKKIVRRRLGEVHPVLRRQGQRRPGVAGRLRLLRKARGLPLVRGSTATSRRGGTRRACHICAPWPTRRRRSTATGTCATGNSSASRGSRSASRASSISAKRFSRRNWRLFPWRTREARPSRSATASGFPS